MVLLIPIEPYQTYTLPNFQDYILNSYHGVDICTPTGYFSA